VTDETVLKQILIISWKDVEMLEDIEKAGIHI